MRSSVWLLLENSIDFEKNMKMYLPSSVKYFQLVSLLKQRRISSLETVSFSVLSGQETRFMLVKYLLLKYKWKVDKNFEKFALCYFIKTCLNMNDMYETYYGVQSDNIWNVIWWIMLVSIYKIEIKFHTWPLAKEYSFLLLMINLSMTFFGSSYSYNLWRRW